MSRGSGTQRATEERFRARAVAVRRRRLGGALIGVLVLALMAALVWAVGFSGLLTTRDVSVTGADPADRSEITAIAEQQIGTPLARVSGDGLASRITEEVPGAKEVDIDRDWPHTLNLNVTSREPALAVRRNTGTFRLHDLGGVPIRTVRSAPKGVPTVSTEEGAKVSGHGVRATQGMLEALPVDVRERVRRVSVDPADQISFELGGTEVIWGDAGKPDLKVKVISILLEEKPEVIDVSAPEAPVTKG